MLKWNSPIDKWLILVWSINTLLRPRIISQLFPFSLSNLKNIRAWESYMHSIVLANNDGVLAIHSATGYVLLLLCSSIGSVAKEILWTLPLSGTLHIIRNTRLPLSWNLNVRKILVEKINSHRRYFQDFGRRILRSKIGLATLYFWMKVSCQFHLIWTKFRFKRCRVSIWSSRWKNYPRLGICISFTWKIRRRKIMRIELHGCDWLFNLDGYKKSVFIIPRNERRGIFNATTTIIPYERFRTISESEKRKKQDSKTAVCNGFFTFDENPYVDLLNAIHLWLSFWLRCFADCRFVSIGDCVKIAGKKIKLRRSRSRSRKRKRIERKTARVTETGRERTRTHLLVRRAERDWGGRQIRGDSTLQLPSS